MLSSCVYTTVQKRATRFASLALLLAFGAFAAPEAQAQTITLTPSSGPFGATFTASLIGFNNRNQKVVLWVYANPA